MKFIKKVEFLANENFPFPSIKRLRECHFSVKSIAEEMPGISDEEVITIAQKENLVILTFDRDYGEIIFKYGMQSPPGVVFFRYIGNDPIFAANCLIEAIFHDNVVFANSFTVIDEHHKRQKKYSGN